MTADPDLDLALEVEQALGSYAHLIVSVRPATRGGDIQSGRACTFAPEIKKRDVCGTRWQDGSEPPCPRCLEKKPILWP